MTTAMALPSAAPTITETTAPAKAAVSATTKGKKTYKSWLKDGVDGGPSSMDVLTDWLAKEHNYARWRGGSPSCSHSNAVSGGENTERTPKKVLLEEIIEQMRQVGIYHRHPKDVASKISTLQSNFRSTREWNETEGERLRQAGVHPQIIHEELLKRFPYWDALSGSFATARPASAGPMSISSIMDRNDDNDDDGKYSSNRSDDRCSGNNDHPLSPRRRRRRLSDSNLLKQLPVADPALGSASHEKEASRFKRSHDNTPPLLPQEKRTEREQLMIEKERTRRIRAQAELVKNLVDAGFSKQEIAEQLRRL